MRILQSCLGSAAIILAYSNQVSAGMPTNFDNWTVTSSTTTSGSCQTGYTCGSALTDAGFYQRMVLSSEPTYFQTIITETDTTTANLDPLQFKDEAFVDTSTLSLTLDCPGGHICGDVIIGPDFLQLEYTDGSNIWFDTLKNNILATDVALGPTPLHLFHTQTGLTLQPGQNLITAYGDTLAAQITNLHLDRSKLTADSEYLELNQQSEAEQKIYREIVDVEITGVTVGADARLAAQLNTPLNVPEGYELRMRILTAQGWRDFISDDHNALSGAAKLDNGFCPEVDSPRYQATFGAGSECLQLTLQDGGPNDGDGDADGSITLTTGPTLKAIELVPVSAVEPISLAAETNHSSTSPNGGGGAWSLWLSLPLLFRIRNRL